MLSHHFGPEFALLSSPVREVDRKLKITRQLERIKDMGEQHNYVAAAGLTGKQTKGNVNGPKLAHYESKGKAISR